MIVPSYHSFVDQANWGEILKARKHGASWLELRTTHGLSALGRAVVDNNAVMVKELLSLGAPPGMNRLTQGERFSPLWASLERNQTDILALLLEAGASPNEAHPHDDDLSPLQYASRMLQGEQVVLLCKAGAEPNGQALAPDQYELFDVVEQPHLKESHGLTTTPYIDLEAIHRLAELNPGDEDHHPPLYFWIKNLSHEFKDITPLMTLLQYGADPTLPALPWPSLWQYAEYIWKEQIGQDKNHPKAGDAMAALEQAVLERETRGGAGLLRESHKRTRL